MAYTLRQNYDVSVRVVKTVQVL